MAVTQSDVDALNQAIRDGVRQVSLGGETVVYNTTDSLIRARNDAQAQLNAETLRAANRVVSRQTLIQYGGRGY